MIVFPLLTDEEEQLIAVSIPSARHNDGTTQCPAEVIKMQRTRPWTEKRPGVEQLTIAHEFEHSSVKFTRAALGHDIDLRSGQVSKFRAVAARQNSHLGDRINTRIDQGIRARAGIKIRGAVESEVARIAPNTVDLLLVYSCSETERILIDRNGAGDEPQ